jgi:hypothetical protein
VVREPDRLTPDGAAQGRKAGCESTAAGRYN